MWIGSVQWTHTLRSGANISTACGQKVSAASTRHSENGVSKIRALERSPLSQNHDAVSPLATSYNESRRPKLESRDPGLETRDPGRDRAVLNSNREILHSARDILGRDSDSVNSHRDFLKPNWNIPNRIGDLLGRAGAKVA